MAVLRRIRAEAGCKELLKYKEHPIAVFFFVETISVIIGQCGKDRWSFLLAAFLLSIFGLAMTTFCNCIGEKIIAGTPHHKKRQLGVLETVVSVVQFNASFLALLHVKDKYTAAVLVLSIPGIAILFSFRRNRRDPELPRFIRPLHTQELPRHICALYDKVRTEETLYEKVRTEEYTEELPRLIRNCTEETLYDNVRTEELPRCTEETLYDKELHRLIRSRTEECTEELPTEEPLRRTEETLYENVETEEFPRHTEETLCDNVRTEECTKELSRHICTEVLPRRIRRLPKHIRSLHTKELPRLIRRIRQ